MEPEGNTRFSIDDIDNNNGDNTFNSEEKAVTLPPKTQGYGQEGNRTETRRSDADQRNESLPGRVLYTPTRLKAKSTK